MQTVLGRRLNSRMRLRPRRSKKNLMLATQLRKLLQQRLAVMATLWPIPNRPLPMLLKMPTMKSTAKLIQVSRATRTLETPSKISWRKTTRSSNMILIAMKSDTRTLKERMRMLLL